MFIRIGKVHTVCQVESDAYIGCLLASGEWRVLSICEGDCKSVIYRLFIHLWGKKSYIGCLGSLDTSQKVYILRLVSISG